MVVLGGAFLPTLHAARSTCDALGGFTDQAIVQQHCTLRAVRLITRFRIPQRQTPPHIAEWGVLRAVIA